MISALAPRYSHFLNIPHSTDESSLQFFKLVLNTLRTSLDRFRGHSTSDSDLAEAVAAHNRNRAARGMSASSGNWSDSNGYIGISPRLYFRAIWSTLAPTTKPPHEHK